MAGHDMRASLSEGECDPRRILEAIGNLGHNGLIGLRYVDHGADWAELAIDYDERLVGDPNTGILASGPIISLMDMTSGMAIWLASKRFQEIVTIDLRLDYLRPARVGHRVHGRAQCQRVARSVAFVSGHAHDGDPERPIARAAGTFMFAAPA